MTANEKMTDNEIIKFIEHAINSAKGEDGFKEIYWEKLEYILDLIKRQNTMIEAFNLRIKHEKAHKEKLAEQSKRQKDEIERVKKELMKCKLEKEMLHQTVEEIKAEAIKEFASKVNPIIEQLIEIMFDDNQTKCMIEHCHKHSSIPCESLTCIDENKAFWKLKIYDIVKEITEVETNQRKEDEGK